MSKRKNTRAIKEANRRARRSNGAWVTLLVIAGFVVWGMLVAFAIDARCDTCPRYACRSNIDCGTCVCALRTAQPYGRCVP